MIQLLLILFLCCVVTKGVHFNGGTIRWEPITPCINSSIVPIRIIQSYSWTYPTIACNIDVPITTSGRSSQNANLTCVTDCSTDGGYSSKPVNILTDCQTVSSSLGLMTSQRSVNINLTAGAHFYLAYVGSAWVALNDPPKSGLQWSIVCSIDLRLRPDGFINTPPVASVVSPQYAIVNKTTQITIPVSDANAGDDVRCRWSTYTAGSRRRRRSYEEEYINQNYASQIYKKPSEDKEMVYIRGRRAGKDPCAKCTSTCDKDCLCTCSVCTGTTCSGSKCSIKTGCPAGTTTVETPGTLAPTSSYPNRQAIDECGGICYPGSVPNGTSLSGCTVSFVGLVSGTWYAIALQVEDFINSTSLTPMSSVPVQLLVYVMDQPPCGLAPVIRPLSRCFDAQVNISISFNISAVTLCDPTVSGIDTIFVSTSISGMNVSDTVDSLTNASVSYATFTWKPQLSQLGSQQLCVTAYTDEQIQSQQYCVTFNVITSPATCITTTTTTTTTTTKTTSTISTSSTASTSTFTTTSTATTTSTSETTTTTSTSTTSTSTTTSSTTSSTSTSTTTSTTTTSTTSTSTTSVTTTTVTTTKKTTSREPQIDWLLILGLSLLAFLLALCCACSCLYWHWWGPAARRRQRRYAEQRSSQETSSPETNYLNNDGFNTNDNINRTSQSQLHVNLSDSISRKSRTTTINPEENLNLSTLCTMPYRHVSIIRVSNSEKPAQTGNTGIMPPIYKDDDQTIPPFQHSTVTVQRLRKSAKLNQTDKNQNDKLQTVDQRISSTLTSTTARVTIIKDPRGKADMKQRDQSSIEMKLIKD